MCEMLDRIEAIGREDGLRQGKVLTLHQFLNMDADSISQELGIPLKEVQRILSEAI